MRGHLHTYTNRNPRCLHSMILQHHLVLIRRHSFAWMSEWKVMKYDVVTLLLTLGHQQQYFIIFLSLGRILYTHPVNRVRCIHLGRGELFVYLPEQISINLGSCSTPEQILWIFNSPRSKSEFHSDGVKYLAKCERSCDCYNKCAGLSLMPRALAKWRVHALLFQIMTACLL